jgi:recombinational DNA repair ATPase RecF
MKAILKSIELQDFKGIEHKKLELDSITNMIELPNGFGKTTIYDAYCWVIFSKNSTQSSRFQIEPYNKEKPKTKVTLVLDVDGSEVVLAKEIGKCYYNCLEVKKNVYEDLLSNIYNVETLEFLSNPLAFMSLNWEVRRNYITGLFCDKVSEDSEFSWLMKSMSISDIRKSKTKQKKEAMDSLKKSGIIIETHLKSISEVVVVDYVVLKSQLEQKSNELEKASNYDWSNYYDVDTKFKTATRLYAGLVAQYKEAELKLKVETDSKQEDSTGCSLCGTKITQKLFDELKATKRNKFLTVMYDLKLEIIAKRDLNKILKDQFQALELSKPNETTNLIISELKKGIDFLKIQISKENDVALLKDKIAKEQKDLDAQTALVMSIEGLMDRFNTFLTDNYFKSINENFEGLFFDVENECKLTNASGTEFKDFSLSEKINTGVQIVSVLSKKIGLQFPLWVDNRESVSELFNIDTQVINLKVK